MAIQLPLHIGLRDAATFTNYYRADNAQVVEQCEQCATRSGEQFVYLHGVNGTGKSHLLQAVCHAAAENNLQAVYLPMHQCIAMSTAIFEGLEHMDIVCIDDLDAIAGNAQWETALFHLFNRVRDAGAYLVIAANANTQELGLALPDLQSRLAWGLAFRLQSLDDAQLAAALQMRAGVRGIELADEVAAYILKRCPRDMNAVFELLEKLDHESLVAKRRLTIPFVKDFL